MSTNALCGAGLGAALMLVAQSNPAAALEAFAYLSGTGSNANACTRAAPCRTAEGAYSKTIAGGNIVTLDPAAYGPLVISKSLTIIGVPGASLGEVQIDAGASDVVALSGLDFFAVATVAVRMVAGGKLLIDDCLIDANGVAGIYIGPTTPSTTVVSNCRITNATTGMWVNSNGTNAGVTLNNVQIDRSRNHAVYASGATGVILNNSTITLNNNALSAVSGATIYSMENNAIVGNTTPGTAPVQVPLK